jgi:hypothetical protein
VTCVSEENKINAYDLNRTERGIREGRGEVKGYDGRGGGVKLV